MAPSDTNFNPNAHLIKLYRCNSIDNTEKPQYITVGIKASNTDPFCKETTVYLGNTGTDLCPVAAIVRLHNAMGKSSWSNVSISRLPPPNTTTAGHRTQGGAKWS